MSSEFSDIQKQMSIRSHEGSSQCYIVCGTHDHLPVNSLNNTAVGTHKLSVLARSLVMTQYRRRATLTELFGFEVCNMPPTPTFPPESHWWPLGMRLLACIFILYSATCLSNTIFMMGNSKKIPFCLVFLPASHSKYSELLS